MSNVDNVMVEISGIEPLTYAVQVRRSPKLSYIPKHKSNNIIK